MTYAITYSRPEYRYTSSPETERIMKALADPQDLEDGLLCVAWDDVRAQMQADLNRKMATVIFRALVPEQP